ncbi:hypothetical protein GGF41_000042 [Coemansia sp. RSA 2531]|nr:hypothetical protein GGF41_000042 [Coemansia sp. RSA 2531]
MPEITFKGKASNKEDLNTIFNGNKYDYAAVITGEVGNDNADALFNAAVKVDAESMNSTVAVFRLPNNPIYSEESMKGYSAMCYIFVRPEHFLMGEGMVELKNYHTKVNTACGLPSYTDIPTYERYYIYLH